MKITSKKFNNEILKFLEGGEMPAQAPVEGAPAEAAPLEGGDEMLLILAACLQAVETLDCNVAMLVCQILLQMAGGGAPAEPLGLPVYKKGGKLSRWI